MSSPAGSVFRDGTFEIISGFSIEQRAAVLRRRQIQTSSNDRTIMSLASLMHECRGGRLELARAGVMRQTVELLVVLCLCVLLVRTFSAEAYVVPTGSMAPTLLGLHREIVCTNCRFTFVVGIDEEGQTGRAVCPNCGERGSIVHRRWNAAAIACSCRSLSMISAGPVWEVAVFHFPGEPSQAYVKRVVGLPGESIRIVGGDIFVEGKIVRKSLPEIRAMRMLVHDSRFQLCDARNFPRWLTPPRGRDSSVETNWRFESGQFAYRAVGSSAGPRTDWLVYKHWDPASGRYGPVRDFYGYNGGDLRADNYVGDLGLEARMSVSNAVDALSVAIRSGSDQFVVRIPVGRRG